MVSITGNNITRWSLYNILTFNYVRRILREWEHGICGVTPVFKYERDINNDTKIRIRLAPRIILPVIDIHITTVINYHYNNLLIYIFFSSYDTNFLLASQIK